MMSTNRKSRTPLERKPLRNPGESIQLERSRLMEEEFAPALVLAICAVLAAAWEWANWYFRWPRQPGAVTLAAMIFVGYGAYKFETIRRRMRTLRLGMEGEKFVGQYLEELRRQGCQVFHDIVTDRSNIDHVVVAPQGVFVIETKTRSKPLRGQTRVEFDGDRILVNGFELDRDPVVQVRGAIRWLSNSLFQSTSRRFPMKGVVVFPGWFADEEGQAKRDIWVLNPQRFPVFLRKEPRRLSPEDIALASSRITIHMQTTF
jgi:hypothetical protein